ncbi:MAG: glycosyltransferase, partial [Candidatus Brocadiae bacterium]|nr:glycosyltransferase [Candidatus Brocadiia bacterium]
VVGKYPALDVIKGWSLVDACTELDAYDPTGERDALLLSMWSGVFQRRYENAPAAGATPQVVISFNDPMRHESEFHLDMARMLGFGEQKPDPYCVTEEAPLPFCGDGRAALLADTSNPDPEWQKKRWPYFRQLAGRLLERGFQVGLIGGPMEAQAFEPSDWPPGVIALMGKYSIPQTAYLIEQADLLVANDSGPAHLSGAVGTEAYVIFGPTLESKNLPLGADVHLIKSDVGCRPCQYLESWAQCRRHTCIEGITVEQVLDAIQGHGAPAGSLPAPVPVAAAKRDEGLVKVDLGCGRFKRKGHIGIDRDPHSDADIICDVTRGIPLATDCVDYLVADNLLEHIGDGLVCLMNEIWRVCKPGADVEVVVPLFPSKKALWDPTHCRYFTEETFTYFDVTSARWEESGSSYGFKPFQVLAKRKLDGELEVTLRPDKSSIAVRSIGGADVGKPRVCFASHNQPGAAGAEKVIHNVANGLARRGHDVTVFYNETPFIHSQPVEVPADTRYKVNWVNGPDLPAFQRALSRAIAEHAPGMDVCLPLWRATSAELIRACQAAGVAVGIWCHNVNYPPERSNSSVFRLADFVVAVTPHAREILKKRFGRTEDIFVIPNACDEEFFAAYRERGPQAVMRRFVFVGRVADQQKGLSTLCAA